MYSGYSRNELVSLKNDRKQKIGKCEEYQNILTNYLASFNQAKKINSTGSVDGGDNDLMVMCKSAWDTNFTSEKVDDNYIAMDDSKKMFEEAYSSGEDSFLFFTEIDKEKNELLTCMENIDSEYERYEGKLDEYINDANGLSSKIKELAEKWKKEIEDIDEAIEKIDNANTQTSSSDVDSFFESGSN